MTPQRIAQLNQRLAEIAQEIAALEEERWQIFRSRYEGD